MSPTSAGKISFIELARQVLEKVGRPMTAGEVWQYAEQQGLAALLQSAGKTPEASLGARLYTAVQKPNSEFAKIGSRPAKFMLKSHAASNPDMLPAAAVQPIAEAAQRTYSERDLHPLLVWFADRNFGAHCRTIYHEKSIKKGEKQNQWIHPDVVGFSLTTLGWTQEVVQLAQKTGALAARLYSFEVKTSLGFPTLREFFFQAVSNSSWAHEGYLVAAEIDEDREFQEELARLSQSFGIGVIRLNTSEPEDSKVVLAAREKSELDWKTVDRVAAQNPDFREFLSSVTKSMTINQLASRNFDNLPTDVELGVYVKKMMRK